MTQEQAVTLAKRDDSGDYIARKIRGQWCVWSRAADHVVEFDVKDTRKPAHWKEDDEDTASERAFEAKS